LVNSPQQSFAKINLSSFFLKNFFVLFVKYNDEFEYIKQKRELQVNLIRSHSSGIGEYLSTKQVRMLMALRINTLSKGYSGISSESLMCVVRAFNKLNLFSTYILFKATSLVHYWVISMRIYFFVATSRSCLPVVPEQGTVGASGDLAPLSHIMLGLLGEGKMWSPSTGVDDAAVVLAKHGLKPLSLKPKEGLALINGTQMITALGAEGLERARNLALQADVIAALTCEVLKGNVMQFDADIHSARPHNGQIEVAGRMRSLLHSDVYPSACFAANTVDRKVQDPYTLRCIPQVHGIVIDTINFVKKYSEIFIDN
jgi:histidine ammonia-lyase